MFERFSHEARAVVVRAQEEATGFGHAYIGTEHLLCALVREGHGVAADVLALHGLSLERVRALVESLVGRGSTTTPSPDDAAALRTLGIDLDAVRARVEEAFGPGALDRPPGRARRARVRLGRRRFRGRCRWSPVPGAGPRPFAPRLKKALELSLREALGLGHGYIGPEHLLLGLVAVPEAMAAHVLRAAGVDLDELRRRVLDRLGRVA